MSKCQNVATIEGTIHVYLCVCVCVCQCVYMSQVLSIRPVGHLHAFSWPAANHLSARGVQPAENQLKISTTTTITYATTTWPCNIEHSFLQTLQLAMVFLFFFFSFGHSPFRLLALAVQKHCGCSQRQEVGAGLRFGHKQSRRCRCRTSCEVRCGALHNARSLNALSVSVSVSISISISISISVSISISISDFNLISATI